MAETGVDRSYITVKVLRELFRNLVAFRSMYEATGQDYITGPDGEIYSLWDIEYLAAQLHLLPERQRQSIDLCLIRNVKERDAAVRMGVSETNPVAMYATEGLKKLVAMVLNGELERFRLEPVVRETGNESRSIAGG